MKTANVLFGQIIKKRPLKKLGLSCIAVITFLLIVSPSPITAAENPVLVSVQIQHQEIIVLPDNTEQVRFPVDIYVTGVNDLKSFELILATDGDILQPAVNEYWGEPSNWSGGGQASGSVGYGSFTITNYTLRDSVSGSGILLKYWFVSNNPGITEIRLRNIVFRDTQGTIIPVETQDATVKVISLTEYVDGQYAILEEEYTTLETEFTSLETVHSQLVSNHAQLESDYSDLESDYGDLYAEHTGLQNDYTVLATENDKLKDDIINLESTVDDLTGQNQSLENDLAEETKRGDTLQTIVFIFVGTTSVLLCLSVFFGLKVSRLSKS